MTIGKIEAKDEAVALAFRDDRIWLTLRDSRMEMPQRSRLHSGPEAKNKGGLG